MARPLDLFHPPVRAWFEATFADGPTPAQAQGWPAIERRESALLLAPTGSGKTLAAFLCCLDRLMFAPAPPRAQRCRVLYVSPLKALAVDVERNLQAPLDGIARLAAARGEAFTLPELGLRTGDTPAAQRARFKRDPTDLLITTPESLYLMLTSQVREALRSVDTVIVDEIHALVPTKRGAHLALSLERLEALVGRPLQRIGLSATQRPLEEVARFLGGAGRAVTVIDAGMKKPLELTVEVPVADLARLPADPGGPRPSIWSAIHPRLLELIRAHGSTLLFVNSRRLAERLASALNELAGEVLVQAHHGSIARAQRLEIEARLKAGAVRGLVATSSLELGIDMGAIDLVIQVGAPPSVASGLQRIGRAGHSVGAASRGVLFPKHRADLLACAALTRAMHEGQVEASYAPRNPLDVLAQQVVAAAAVDTWSVDALFDLVRRAAPFTELTRATFESVLDLLAGRYASDDLAGLRPRLTWDRLAGTVVAREGAGRVAIANGGTIPDRGLYGVYLVGADPRRARVGELDEEMVFETKVGETFVLGASTWRVEEITFDRVLVSPAPGEPGKLPFWHGDAASRPYEVGRRIGALGRELRGLSVPAAVERLVRIHDLDARAADALLRYLAEQFEATGTLPDDRTLVIERCRDELGDWRICVLSPAGTAVHAPWAMAVVARIRERLGLEVQALWTNDGFALRLPGTEHPPEAELFLMSPAELELRLRAELGSTALFAARFRENAARALLLPRRRPGQRTPLWQQRKRSADLLAVAARHPQFPILLETYRECLADVFDLPSLRALLGEVERGELQVKITDSKTPSPFAASLLFGFVASVIYEGDAPLAERRAQALAIDPAQLRALLGEAELRALLDPSAILQLEAELQSLDEKRRARSPDALHDLLLRVGELSAVELAARSTGDWLPRLVEARRALPVTVAGEARFIPVEDAARYRDALGVTLPEGLPAAFLTPVEAPLRDLVLRFARTHAPFTRAELSQRLGLAGAVLEPLLTALIGEERIVEGAFRPEGSGVELCEPEVLRGLRRRSLAKLKQEVEPVEPAVLGRFLGRWHGLTLQRSGLDALLDTLEQLQGLPLPASLLESEILPARHPGFSPAELDALFAAGELVWVGVEALGERDGKIAIYLADQLPRLLPARDDAELSAKEAAIVAHLRARGASSSTELQQALGGFPAENTAALWKLVWRGLLTHDGFGVLRSLAPPPSERERRAAYVINPFRSRRIAPEEPGGRWSLLGPRLTHRPTPTEQSTALAQQLLARHGIVTREVALAEGLPGGFTAIYRVLRAMEERGAIRRGFFVRGVGAVQFAHPEALELLRSLREEPGSLTLTLASALDPANPYGTLLPWPEGGNATRAPARTAGARVILGNGALLAYLARGGRQLQVWLPGDPSIVRALAEKLAELGRRGRELLLIEEIDGAPAAAHALAPELQRVGFVSTPLGLQLRRA